LSRRVAVVTSSSPPRTNHSVNRVAHRYPDLRQSRAENRSGIQPKSVRKSSKINQKSTPGAPRDASGAPGAPQERQRAPQEGPRKPPGAPGEPPGAPGGPPGAPGGLPRPPRGVEKVAREAPTALRGDQNDPKTAFGSVFSVNLVRDPLSTQFSHDFRSNLLPKTVCDSRANFVRSSR